MTTIEPTEIPYTIYDWGLQVIHFIQQAESPFLTIIMKGLSLLGTPLFLLLYIGILYWAINQKQGTLSALTLMFSAGINTAIKFSLKIPRPYIRDASVGLAVENSYSTPSGHAQSSSTFWTITGRFWKSAIRYVLIFALPVLIGFSRIYLGVHYPTDVLLGWGIGYGIAGITILLYPLIAKFILPQRKTIKLLFIAIIAFILLKLCKQDTTFPALFLGFGFGAVMLSEKKEFDATTGNILQKALRCIIGFAGAGLLFCIFEFLIPQHAFGQTGLIRFIKYFTISIWVSWLAPKVFLALKIASKEEH